MTLGSQHWFPTPSSAANAEKLKMISPTSLRARVLAASVAVPTRCIHVRFGRQERGRSQFSVACFPLNLTSLDKQGHRDSGIQSPALWVSRAGAGQQWGSDPWVVARRVCSCLSHLLGSALILHPHDCGSWSVLHYLGLLLKLSLELLLLQPSVL